MGLLDRFRGRTAGRAGGSGTEGYLRTWSRARAGVEAYVEPRTTVTETTVVLVAHDGEWTRRRVGNPGRATKIARSLKIPIYDVQLTGYPQRMRDHDARERIRRKHTREDELRRRLTDGLADG